MVDHDTVALLNDLLAQAKKGEIEGIACMCIHPDRRYSTNCVGQAKDEPALTIGVLYLMQQDLAAQILAAW